MSEDPNSKGYWKQRALRAEERYLGLQSEHFAAVEEYRSEAIEAEEEIRVLRKFGEMSTDPLPTLTALVSYMESIRQ